MRYLFNRNTARRAAGSLLLGASLWLALAVPDTHAGQRVSPQHSQLQRVLDGGVLRVCIWPDYYAVTYRNPRTRQLS